MGIQSETMTTTQNTINNQKNNNVLLLLTLNLIAAATSENGIGINGDLPWKRLPTDMNYFQNITIELKHLEEKPLAKNHSQNQQVEEEEDNSSNNKENVVIMGRKTWESIPKRLRPLSQRLNVVLSRNEEFLKTLPLNVLGFTSFHEAIQYFLSNTAHHHQTIYIVGGSHIYKEALNYNLTNNNKVININPNQEKIQTPLIRKRIFLTRVKRQDGQSIQCDTFFPEFSLKEYRQIQDTCSWLKSKGFHRLEQSKVLENDHELEFLLFEQN